LITVHKAPDLTNLVDTAVFKIADTACFLWKYIDDAHIVYDKRSGHSQALNAFACEIFDIIEDGPCRLSDIMVEVQKVLENPLTDEQRQQVRMTVAAFDKMGLIEPAKPE